MPRTNRPTVFPSSRLSIRKKKKKKEKKKKKKKKKEKKDLFVGDTGLLEFLGRLVGFIRRRGRVSRNGRGSERL